MWWEKIVSKQDVSARLSHCIWFDTFISSSSVWLWQQYLRVRDLDAIVIRPRDSSIFHWRSWATFWGIQLCDPLVSTSACSWRQFTFTWIIALDQQRVVGRVNTDDRVGLDVDANHLLFRNARHTLFYLGPCTQRPEQCLRRRLRPEPQKMSDSVANSDLGVLDPIELDGHDVGFMRGSARCWVWTTVIA